MATARWTAAITVSLLLLMASPAPAQVNFTTFTSGHGRFAVLMPGTPKHTTKVDKEYGTSAPYDIHLFIASAAKLIFLVGYSDYPADFRPDADQELKTNQKNFIRSVKGELIASKRIEFHRGPGDLLAALEFTTATPDYNFKSIIIWDGARTYQIVAGSPKGTDATRELDRFLASFVLRRAN